MDLVGAIDTLERAIGIIEKVITAVRLGTYQQGHSIGRSLQRHGSGAEHLRNGWPEVDSFGANNFCQ